MAPADPGSARYSVNDVAALARDASMSSTYKPALLKALVRIVGRDHDREIPLRRIGHEFVRLYWVQTVVFRLRQAATVLAEPEVVRRIRRAAELARARRLEDLPAADRDRLDREMARVLTYNVLDAFHRSMPAAMPPLFEWSVPSPAIVVEEAAQAFIRSNAQALESIANLWWARYLEKVNGLAPLVIEKVERDGAERGSLSRYLRILQHVDSAECFYCARPLDAGTTHVDHVIPWSFLLADPFWDLVLACARCNLSKSDVLPQRRYVDKLVQTGARRATLHLPVGFASALLPGDDIYPFYDAALSVEWPQGWGPE